VNPPLVTTIQIDENTRRKLFGIITKIQAETGRRVSYDEALNVLMKQAETVRKARKEFERLADSIRLDESALDELAELKRSEKEKLEKKFS
jgi:hypothetical protein